MSVSESSPQRLGFSASRWRHLILLLVFVLAQTAALIHAEIHPFHEHDAGCVVYTAVEHHTPLTATLAHPLPLAPLGAILTSSHPQSIPVAGLTPFWARAPPRHAS